MALVYRPRRNGTAYGKWYVRFRDPLTKRLVIRAGYADKTATLQLAARLVKEAERHAEGLGPPPAVKRIETLDALRAELRQSIIDSGGSLKHANLTDQRLRDLFAWCDWKTARELNPAAVVRALAERRKREGESRGEKKQRIRFGLTSTNNYLQCVKQFGRWLARRNKGYDPFVELDKLNAETDRRHVRRSLTHDELKRLLNVTASSDRPFKKLDGIDRASLYHVAAYTGLRASELHRLTIDDFTFDPPGVCVTAEQKKRRETPLPLHPELVDVVRDQAEKRPGRLWPGAWLKHTVRMLRRDLKEAGIAWKTRDGLVDLHALRTTFITNLGRAGVPLVVTQKLARHSDPRTTARHYMRLNQDDLSDGLARLRIARMPARTGPGRDVG